MRRLSVQLVFSGDPLAKMVTSTILPQLLMCCKISCNRQVDFCNLPEILLNPITLTA